MDRTGDHGRADETDETGSRPGSLTRAAAPQPACRSRVPAPGTPSRGLCLLEDFVEVAQAGVATLGHGDRLLNGRETALNDVQARMRRRERGQRLPQPATASSPSGQEEVQRSSDALAVDARTTLARPSVPGGTP